MVGTVLSGHVINLRRRADRKARFLDWNGGHAVHWVWHDAVEPDQVDRADRAVVGADIDASDAEIATALSHRRQWLACVDSGHPRLIFEDDCCLRHGAEATLAAALAEGDMVFLGCNADAAVVLELPDRLFAHVTYGNTAHGQPGYFDHFAHQAPPVPPPHLHRTYLIWGLLAYAVLPTGAEKLLAECFPPPSAKCRFVPARSDRAKLCGGRYGQCRASTRQRAGLGLFSAGGGGAQW